MDILKIQDYVIKKNGRELPVRRIKKIYANKYSQEYMEEKAKLDVQKESK